MMKTLKSVYKWSGEQQEAFYKNLLSTIYDVGYPIEYVSKYKSKLREYDAAGEKVPPLMTTYMFKISVEAKCWKWHATVSTVARFKKWTLEDLYQDFISFNQNKTKSK